MQQTKIKIEEQKIDDNIIANSIWGIWHEIMIIK
jgi:hypothetical protein